MAVDHPPSASTFPGRKRSRPSKTETKMFLVAKRLAMLRDDHDLLPETVAVENSRQFESTKPLKESSDDSSPDCIIKHKISAIRRKCGSHKKMRVVSDDESTEDRVVVKAEPRKKKRDFMDDFNLKLPAIDRAKEFQANLLDEYPSFVKPMLRSHVTQGFWLGLPRKFCDHLPSCDSTMVLVDEDGRECRTKFLAQKSGLSAGWRAFSVEHNLQEGDVVVFQLIEPTTFKVYIVRADILGEVDGALSLLNLDACGGQMISDPLDNVIKKEDNPLSIEDNVQGSSDIDIESDMVDGIRFSDTITSFEGTKSFKSFTIVVDGLVIDSKFSENVRRKYYELCCSQGVFLHQHLLRGLNCNLVAGLISETINIADAMKACKATTPHDDVLVWEKTLKGFELLGMNVSFLFARLNLLLGVENESNVIHESNRLSEAMLENARAEERMRDLEAKLLELKENMEEIDLELKAEVSKSARKRELKIKDIVSAPW